MAKMKDHPTVKKIRAQVAERPREPEVIDAAWLKQLCLEAGADDVGFVEIGREALDDQRDDIFGAFQQTKTLISIVAKMNREPVRSPMRSIANREFHSTGHDVDEINRHIVRQLEDRGIRAMNPSMAFPMEVQRFPGKTWVVSHKPVAVAAGLGKMGIHRNVIHPKFGNFILLGTILLGAEVSEYDQPIDYNPCVECKLCVAACPVGAIGSDGHFNAGACITHNYREFLGGFVDWAEQMAEANGRKDLAEKVTVGEQVSMWQSLSYGANYNAAYCLAVCPAGEDVISPFLEDRKEWLNAFMKPLTDKEEVIYATKHSDAVAHVQKRFPHKTLKIVGNGTRPQTVEGFVRYAPHVFQRGQAKGLESTFHFTFTGSEAQLATFEIKNQTLTVYNDHRGEPDVHVTIDSDSWVKLLNELTHPVWEMVRFRMRVKGPIRKLLHFQRCFG